MKPLSEWTDAELHEVLEVHPPYTGGCTAREVSGELLRRERERCAAECEAMMAILVGHAGHDCDSCTALEEMAGIIRKLK